MLHVISDLNIGGAQRLLSDLLPKLDENCEVSLLVFRDANDPKFYSLIINKGIDYHSLHAASLFDMTILPKLIKMMRRYDIIHAHLFHALYWVAIASIFCKSKLIYTEHSTSNSRRGKPYLAPIERFIYGRYDRIVSISSEVQESLLCWLRQCDKRFCVICNGINTQVYNSVSPIKDFNYTIIMISRFAPAKDQQTLIKALALLDSRIHVVFVGDGETRDSCEQLAKSLNVHSRTLFVGYQSDIEKWISRSDIGVQSSNWEGFGLTALEVMASHRPMIASDVDGLKQVVDGAGLVFKKGDEIDLANKISYVYSSKSVYDSICDSCFNRASQYDISSIAKEYLNVYNEMI